MQFFLKKSLLIDDILKRFVHASFNVYGILKYTFIVWRKQVTVEHFK